MQMVCQYNLVFLVAYYPHRKTAVNCICMALYAFFNTDM